MSGPLAGAPLRCVRSTCAFRRVHSAHRRACVAHVPRQEHGASEMRRLLSPKKKESDSESWSIVVINHHLNLPSLDLFHSVSSTAKSPWVRLDDVHGQTGNGEIAVELVRDRVARKSKRRNRRVSGWMQPLSLQPCFSP